MATQSRRGWFQFGMRTMFAVMTLAAFGTWRIKKWQYGNEWVVIASMRSFRNVENAVKNELNPNGIECGCFGAKARYIMVHRKDSKRAREVLLNSESLKRFQLRIEEEDLGL